MRARFKDWDESRRSMWIRYVTFSYLILDFILTLFMVLRDVATEKGAKSVQALDAPMISIGKGDAIIQVLPTGLRFWEKLGLDPKGGRKDLSAFVIYEDEGEGRQALVETWLTDVCGAYQVSCDWVFIEMKFG